MKRGTLWHPLTQHKIFPDMISIARAQGAHLYTKDGRRLIDGISSWWVNTHGHCHPAIVAAVQEQAARMDQIIFAGFSHEPAETFAEMLMQAVERSLGPGLAHVFLSDSGSTAVEAALKMAIGHFEHRGTPRRVLVALEGGYHGDTFGAMAIGARSIYNALYEPYLFEVARIPFPEGQDGHNTLQAFSALLERESNNIAALILEPLVQGAAGMQVYSPGILQQLAHLCRAHGTLLIADEVMTGFGRTGTMFACAQAKITPDILCLSKGITGGFLPMGATLASREIYDSFYSTDRGRQFFHSSSYTGNPLSCAAALANLEVWEREPVQERIATLCGAQAQAAQRLQMHSGACNVRQIGTILALDLPVADPGYLSAMAPQLYRFYIDQGVLLRPIGHTVYTMPPYCVDEQDRETLYAAIERSLDHFGHARPERAA